MSGSKSSASKIKLSSFNELFDSGNSAPSIIPGGPSTIGVSVVDIPIDKLKPFKNHPFKVIHNTEMDELIDSIKANGVIEPIVVRHDNEDDMYEIIAGHRRTYAAEKAELKRIPGKIITVDDDIATIYMVDSNKYREKFLPSEKAFSYKMKLDAIKHQGKKTSAQNVEKGLSVDIIGEENGESRETIRRYIRLTYLIPDLIKMVDADKVKFITAVEISYLSEEIQGWLYEDVLCKQNVKPAQIASLRKHLEKNTMSREEFARFFAPKNTVSVVSQISATKISKFFPPHYGKKDIEKILEKVLNTTTVKKMIEELTGYNAEE